jgi:non-heme chloroperoxidase
MKTRTFLAVGLWLAGAVVVTAQDDSTDKSPHKSAFIKGNGVRLHYLDWGGKGETLLFLHGMGGTAHHYDDFAPRFTNQFRVLGLTRRGQGESEMPESGYDAATLVEDIRQFLDALKIQRVVLAGHSFAGDELTRLAVEYPDRVIKLIYFDSAYDHSRVPESLRWKPLHGVAPENLPTKEERESVDGGRRWVMRLWGEKTGRTIYSMIEGTYAEKHEYAKIRAPTLAFFAIGDCPSSPAKCRGFDREKIVAWVESLPEPQRKDAQEFVKAKRKYYELEIEHFRREIPNGRVIVFTNADHVCFIDTEPEVLREMREFLSH